MTTSHSATDTSSEALNDALISAISALFARESKTFILNDLKDMVAQNPSVLDVVLVARRSILQLAILKGLNDVVKYLVDTKPALIRHIDRQRHTAIHTAILNDKDKNMIRILVQKDPLACTIGDAEGQTPLHLAVRKDDLALVKLLPKNHGMIYQENIYQKTPYQLAADKPTIITEFVAYSSKLSDASKIFPPSLTRQINQEAITKLNNRFPNLDIFARDKHFSRELELPSQPFASLGEVPNLLLRTPMTSPSVSPSPKSTSSTPHTPSPTPTLFASPKGIGKASSQGENGTKIERIHKKNSATTAAERAAEASQSSDSSATPDPCTFNLDILAKDDKPGLIKYLESGGEPNTVLGSLGRPILVTAFLLAVPDDKTKKKAKDLKAETFYHLLTLADVNQQDKKGKTLFDRLQPNYELKIDLLKLARTKLLADLEQFHRHQNQVLGQIDAQLEAVLMNAGLDEFTLRVDKVFPSMPLEKLTTYPPLTEKVETQEQAPAAETFSWEEIIWKICALQPLNLKDSVPQQGVSKSYLNAMVNALQSKITSRQIIAIIDDLYEHFTPTQRLVAVFMIKKMLLSHANPDNLLNNASYQRLQKKMDLYLPCHSKTIQTKLEALCKANNEFNENRLVKNYHALDAFLSSQPRVEPIQRFDDLLNEAAANPDYQHVAAVAHEFRCMMLHIIQEISIIEFYGAKWEGQHAINSAPSITAQTQLTNHISNYIQQKLILADAELAAKFLKLFILVTEHLCKDNHVIGPDLITAQIIISALDNGEVQRNKAMFAALPEKIKIKYQELQELLTPSSRFVWVAAHQASHLYGLPFMLIILSTLGLMYTNGSDYLSTANLLGDVIEKFWLEQRKCKQVLGQKPHTDCEQVFKYRDFLGSKKLTILASRKHPPLISISKYFTVDEIYDQLHPLLLDKIVPFINYEEKKYAPNEILDALGECLYFARKQLIHANKPTNEVQLFDAKAKALFALVKTSFEKLTTKPVVNVMEDSKPQNPLYGADFLRVLSGAVHYRHSPRFHTRNSEDQAFMRYLNRLHQIPRVAEPVAVKPAAAEELKMPEWELESVPTPKRGSSPAPSMLFPSATPKAAAKDLQTPTTPSTAKP